MPCILIAYQLSSYEPVVRLDRNGLNIRFNIYYQKNCPARSITKFNRVVASLGLDLRASAKPVASPNVAYRKVGLQPFRRQSVATVAQARPAKASTQHSSVHQLGRSSLFRFPQGSSLSCDYSCMSSESQTKSSWSIKINLGESRSTARLKRS